MKSFAQLPSVFARPSDQEAPMPQEPASLRDQAFPSNEEYRELVAQHHEFESRLRTLAAKAVLSDDEQLEETTLKKKKLQVKDRMQALARQAREGAAQAS
jgi:uncharacterized protein YdcH (DUF465 family)